MSDVPPLTVAALAGAIDGVLRDSFPYVAVVGEVGKATLHGNGHFYLDLKDDKALINAVMWGSDVAKQANLPQQGESVIAHGRITTYKMRSTYQLQVFRFEPVGAGTLQQQLDALKAKLLAEGLFDSSRKRPLPRLPRKIGIITSPTGAVIQDMASRLKARCPRPVVLWPATVQGPTAAGEVIKALQGFQHLEGDARPDLIIIARGGGSFEDLMPFNDEALVRAVAACSIPTVSAIGHEPDVTLCDFAADLRAATPTAAAELVVPVRDDLLAELAAGQAWLTRTLRQQLDGHAKDVTTLRKLLPDAGRLLGQARQRLDETSARFVSRGPGLITYQHERLNGMARVLAAHRPMAPLERGFALVRDAQGGVVRSHLAPAGDVMIQFGDGQRKGTLA